MTGHPTYQRFFAELKRRRVFRVMAVYGVVAFGVLQVADIAFPRLGLPEWTITLVLLLSLLGFPIAIVLAWAFEQTPEGLKRTEDAEEHEISEIASAPVGQRWPVGVAAAAGTALFLVGAWWIFDGPTPNSTVPALDSDAPVESIAVLPFADMSPDGDQAYFGDGLAEELLDALAKVEGLSVAARTSSFRFRGDSVDIGEVARQLGVQTILEGSVRSGGGRVRITAQLVNAAGFHIWSETYDRSVDQMVDLITVQEEIAQSIVAALSLAPDTLAGEALETLVAQGTDNLAAYNAFLRGRHLSEQRSPQSMEAGAAQLERAVELDPDYALAWAHLAMTSNLRISWGFSEDSLVEQRGADAAQRALELNPLLAEAHAARGIIHWLARDSAATDQAFARAIELNPRFPTAWQWRGEHLSDGGYPEEGIPYLETARELDPLSPIILVDLGEAYSRAGRYAEADSLIASAFELEPNFRPAIQSLAEFALRNGDAEAVLEARQRFGAGLNDAQPGIAWIVDALTFADQHEEAVEEFRRAVPSDTSSVPEYALYGVDEFLSSLNIVEGPEAVRDFVDAHAARLTQIDSMQAAHIVGYAAALMGDEAGARAAIDFLGRSFESYEEGGNPTYSIRIAAVLGDLETLLAIFETFPDGRYNVYTRFEFDHRPQADGLRDEPAFQEFMDRFAPYYVPAQSP